VLQNVSNKAKGSNRASGSHGWHNVSVSGPTDLFRSGPRKSDELGIIHDAQEITGDRDSGCSVSRVYHSQYQQKQERQQRQGIRRDFEVSVDRSR
jgi:hypothetical protein